MDTSFGPVIGVCTYLEREEEAQKKPNTKTEIIEELQMETLERNHQKFKSGEEVCNGHQNAEHNEVYESHNHENQCERYKKHTKHN